MANCMDRLSLVRRTRRLASSAGVNAAPLRGTVSRAASLKVALAFVRRPQEWGIVGLLRPIVRRILRLAHKSTHNLETVISPPHVERSRRHTERPTRSRCLASPAPHCRSTRRSSTRSAVASPAVLRPLCADSSRIPEGRFNDCRGIDDEPGDQRLTGNS